MSIAEKGQGLILLQTGSLQLFLVFCRACRRMRPCGGENSVMSGNRAGEISFFYRTMRQLTVCRVRLVFKRDVERMRGAIVCFSQLVERVGFAVESVPAREALSSPAPKTPVASRLEMNPSYRCVSFTISSRSLRSCWRTWLLTLTLSRVCYRYREQQFVIWRWMVGSKRIKRLLPAKMPDL